MGLLRNTMTVGIMRLLLTILVFSSDLVAARYLGVAFKGEFFFLTSTILLVGVLLTGGLHLGNIYYSRFISFPELAANSLVFLLGTGVISLLVGFPLLTHVPILSQAGVGLKVAFLTCIVAESAFAIFLNFFVAANRLNDYAYVRLLRRGLFLVLLLVAWATWHASLGLTIGLYLITSLMTVVIMGAKLFQASEVYQYSLGSLGKCLSYGMRSQAMVSIDMANLQLNAILLGFWANPVQSGLYSVALNFGQALWVLVGVLGIVVQSGVNFSMQQQQENLAKLSRCGLFLMTVGGIILFLFSTDIIRIGYGQEFLGAAPLMKIIIPGFVCYALYSLASNFMIVNGRAGITLLASLGGLLVNIVLCITMIPSLGGKGAAQALLSGYFVSTLLLLIILKYTFKISLTSLILLRKSDVITLYNKLYLLISNKLKYKYNTGE